MDHLRNIIPHLSMRLLCLRAPAGSKRCNEMRPHLEAIANGDLWGKRILFAESDISDQRGYTSYLEMYGVLKLPTIVLFRNGNPTQYPLDDPLTQESVEGWLASTTQSEPLPRGTRTAERRCAGSTTRRWSVSRCTRRRPSARRRRR